MPFRARGYPPDPALFSLDKGRSMVAGVANACVFCGSRAGRLTKEHVFPDWISDLFGREPNGTAELIESDGSVRPFPATVFQQQVRVVCKPCNEGWMGSLEGAVKDFLGPMLHDGQPTTLSRAQQQTLATWAVKTAIMMDQLHPNEAIIPSAQYTAFYEAQAPLPEHLVWLAVREQIEDDTKRPLLGSVLKQSVGEFLIDPESAKHAGQWQKEGRNIYRITFTIGHVAFQVFGHNLPIGIRVGTPERDVARLINVSSEPVDWPPTEPIELIGGLRGLHDAFA